jgi:hypothetical protein
MGAFAIAIVLLFSGCNMGAPRSKSGYNYRELWEPSDGLFTGPSGTYTVYRRGESTTEKVQTPSPGTEQGHDDKPANGANQAH